jgi:hypothetical protein
LIEERVGNKHKVDQAEMKGDSGEGATGRKMTGELCGMEYYDHTGRAGFALGFHGLRPGLGVMKSGGISSFSGLRYRGNPDGLSACFVIPETSLRRSGVPFPFILAEPRPVRAGRCSAFPRFP